MNQYATPIKETYTCPSKQPKTMSQTRDGDWVCLNCNNLNFSFRKKCNRCKTQTREQNEASSAYSYYYFSKPYYYGEDAQCETYAYPKLEADSSLNKENQTAEKETHSLSQEKEIHALTTEKEHPLKPLSDKQNNQTPEKATRRAQLPSVSPLIKKYNLRQADSTIQRKGKGIFENESLWSGIQVRDFGQALLDDPDKLDQWEIDESAQQEQLERIIKRIII